MNFWIVVFVLIFLAVGVSLIFLSYQFSLLPIFVKVAKGNKFLAFIFGLLVNVIALLIFALWLNMMNAFVVYLHFIVFYIICSVIEFIVSKLKKRSKNSSRVGIIALVFTMIYLAYGAIANYTVWRTDYELITAKDIGNLKVAMIADSHIGVTFDGKGFAKRLDEINTAKPDILIIAGDFVDDDTSREDMLEACEALGHFSCPYGIYYAMGNHDRGYYDTRNFTGSELFAELTKNNVHVMVDDVILVDDRFYVVGRADKTTGVNGRKRQMMEQLTTNLDSDKYIIVIDHQPSDYNAEAEAGADLVLSGHTHGGQLIPIAYMGVMLSQNDAVYGYERRLNTDFIVTSGISCWSLKFKTGCHSEYDIIDIASMKN